MKSITYDDIKDTLASAIGGGSLSDDVDEDMLDYFINVLLALEPSSLTTDEIRETVEPFLESFEDHDYSDDEALLDQVTLSLEKLLLGNSNESSSELKLLDSSKQVNMQEELKKSEANGILVGDVKKVQANANTVKDQYSSTESSKERRKARQELEKARKEHEASLKSLEEEEERLASAGKVAEMILPDYSSGRNDRDIQCNNVCIALDNGRSLLDDAELKFSYGRRYGLVGKNGIGKTTLLKAIAAFDIMGFPRHHRVLHVRQEIRGSDVSVLDTVLAADVERNNLLQEEREVLARLEGVEGGSTVTDNDSDVSLNEKMSKLKASLTNDKKFEADLKRLDQIYSRLSIIGADNATTRAATILTGLQFSHEMQYSPTSALSGGWRMRVSLAAALFIEPDLLMLDEPTNHLDIEAVLWLEAYLQSYKHTVVIVSHDRGFLNEVCTDIILFQNQKLEYFKGNYDTYVKTSDEALKNRVKEYEAYIEKRTHIMEFIEKFRCNAKRATLVQSRIKTVEKMDLEAPEKVEIPAKWKFQLPAAEPIGRPIIAIDDVYFDYEKSKSKNESLLQKVNFGVDLESRIGIMGVNGKYIHE